MRTGDDDVFGWYPLPLKVSKVFTNNEIGLDLEAVAGCQLSVENRQWQKRNDLRSVSVSAIR